MMRGCGEGARNDSTRRRSREPRAFFLHAEPQRPSRFPRASPIVVEHPPPQGSRAMTPFRYRDDDSSSGIILGAIVGALAGFAAGMYMAQHAGTDATKLKGSADAE